MVITRRDKDEHKQYKENVKQSHAEIREITKSSSNKPKNTSPNNAITELKDPDSESKILNTVGYAYLKSFLKALKNYKKYIFPITDPRRANSVKHSIGMIILYTLLLFMFQFGSRNAIHKVLSRGHIRKTVGRALGIKMDAIHGDTINNALSKLEPKEVERARDRIIKNITKDKLVKGKMPLGKVCIAIDGVQKCTRDNKNETPEFLERDFKKGEGSSQQYIYTVEVNMIFNDMTSIPIFTQFLTYDGNSNTSKQECELSAFPKVIKKIKQLFGKDVVLLLDKLYANQNVIKLCIDNQMDYMIVLPTNKLLDINKDLNKVTNQDDFKYDTLMVNNRFQELSYHNESKWKGLNINSIACYEKYYTTCQHTGEKLVQYSSHKWITNIKVTDDNISDLANEIARKRWGIEESNNTEKNRGYNYKHLFSHNWNAIQSFHNLMRLAHAINIVSQKSIVL